MRHPFPNEIRQLSDEELESRNRVLLLMLFEMLRATHRTFLDEPQRFGRDLDILFVGLAIWLGDYEGRPMTPHKLAEYLGMPRATTIRKIEELKRRGIAQDGPDNAVLIVPDVLKTEKARDRKRYWINTFWAGVDQMSKLDAQPADLVQ